jgi:hypothetical protein
MYRPLSLALPTPYFARASACCACFTKPGSFVAALAILAACKHGGDDSGDTDVGDGCITADGRSFPTIGDAIAFASAGDTIHLCEGELEESVTVDKDLTIEGEGLGDTFWHDFDVDPVIHLTGDANLVITGIGFTSDLSGIKADGNGSLEVRASKFYSANTYAIEASNTAVTVHAVEIEGAQWGGVRVQGGTLDMDASSISGTLGFGVSLEDGAVGNISDNDIGGIQFTGDGTDVTDGWGVWVIDSTAALSLNRFSGNVIADVEAEGTLSELTMNGDTSTGSYAGVWLDGPGATLTDVVIDQYQQYGIVDLSAVEITLENVQITTTHDVSNPQTAFDDFSGSFGIIALGGDVTLTNSIVSGNNGGGIYQSVGNNTTVDMELNGVTVDDNARYGVVTFGGTMELTDVTVTHTLDDALTCEDSGYIYCNFTVAPIQSDLTWTGGSLADNTAQYGLTALSGAADVSGVTFSNNDGYAALIQASSFRCDACTFAATREGGLLLQDGASGVVTNSAFTDAAFSQTSEWYDYYSTYQYTTYYAAQDVLLFTSSLSIALTTFTNGENGIYSYGSQVDVAESSWTGYNQAPVTAFGGSTVTLTDVDMTNIGNEPLYCLDSAAQLQRVNITDVNEYNYKYELYTDGVLTQSSDTTSVGLGIYGSSCALSAEDLKMEDVKGRPILLYDGTLSLDGAILRGANTSGFSSDAAISATFSSGPPDVFIHHTEVTGVTNGSGISVMGSASYPGGYTEISGVTLGADDGNGHAGIASAGVFLSTLDPVTVDGFDITGTGGDGIYTNAVRGTITGASGAWRGTIVEPGAHGIEAQFSELSIEDTTVTEPTLSGMMLGSGTQSLNANLVSGAGRYGLECTLSPTQTQIVGCDSNTLEGALGATLDCAGCSTVVDTGDTAVVIDSDTSTP